MHDIQTSQSNNNANGSEFKVFRPSTLVEAGTGRSDPIGHVASALAQRPSP